MNNEHSIHEIFKVADSSSINVSILKDKEGIISEGDNSTNLDIDYSKSLVFNISKQSKLKYKWIKILDKKNNFLKEIPLSFSVEEKENQKQLKASFNTLTVNTVQNFLDYAEKDQAKKQTETYTYLLLNKNNQQKMKLNYHEYGDWFEVEIF
ncbi:hypothetical protein ETU09_10460 [Apibacter muscae]|uniref:Uncharacterized protein n=1 Tax=Apibacter muscae TaxID=2509004 RepID=A0A563D7P6_9FLAO|nr:hypothetical protein [Apibacter muscae]TWP26117.1 hypothetical protein ETU09_10460 [Apibacter muscae]